MTATTMLDKADGLRLATTMTMKALVYRGPGKKALEDHARPEIAAPTDAIVKITKTTICGTDLHILKGDVPTCLPGRILGHEGVGVIEQVGPASRIQARRPGPDLVYLACGKCEYCRQRCFRIARPAAGFSATRSTALRPNMSASRMPTPASTDSARRRRGSAGDAERHSADRFRMRRLNGKVAPGSTVAIVGSGPIGLAALLTAQLYSPAEIIMIDLDDNRLEVAKRFGATQTVNSSDGKAAEAVMELTGKRGVDTAIEAVGIPATFELCEQFVHRVAPSPISACTGKGRSASRAPLGPQHHDHHAAGRHRQYADAAQDTCGRKDRPETFHYPSFQARPHPRCLRDLRDAAKTKALKVIIEA